MPSPVNVAKRSVLQDWVHELPFMQQAVLMTAVRGPDGIRKDHPVKVLCRWLRRSFLLCAFHGRAHLDFDPDDGGCGSFTGCLQVEGGGYGPDGGVYGVDNAFDLYLRSVDELPHHFQLHFMHAAEVLGYKHPAPDVREWWSFTYRSIVSDAHLSPESEAAMDARLRDPAQGWRAAESVVAR